MSSSCTIDAPYHVLSHRASVLGCSTAPAPHDFPVAWRVGVTARSRLTTLPAGGILLILTTVRRSSGVFIILESAQLPEGQARANATPRAASQSGTGYRRAAPLRLLPLASHRTVGTGRPGGATERGHGHGGTRARCASPCATARQGFTHRLRGHLPQRLPTHPTRRIRCVQPPRCDRYAHHHTASAGRMRASGELTEPDCLTRRWR